jgi:hypothetical protein
MRFWGLTTRLVCTWLTCVVLALAAAPAGAPRLTVPTEQCAESHGERTERELEAQVARASAPAQPSEPETAHPPRAPAVRRPVLATDHTVRIPQLYIRHCALLC